MRQRMLALAFGFVFAGCGGTTPAPKAHTPTPEEMPLEESPSETISQPMTEITRSTINRAMTEGFGRFLQRVSVEAELSDGKFVGFRIVRFAEPKDWLGVGLVPGDVVTQVNDLTIERPEQAYLAFVALKSRKSLDVVYLRTGRTMHLSLPIIEDVPAVTEPAKAAPAPEKASSAKSKEKAEKPKDDKPAAKP